MHTTHLQQHRPHAPSFKKWMLASALTLAMGPAFAAAVAISPLQGTMASAQWSYAEWFSRYSATLDATTLAAFKNSPGNANGLDLFASEGSVKVTFLGTGATRNANLFLAYEGNSNFNSASFWNPVYASGGSNNTNVYNPLNSANALFQTRDGCSFAQAKNGNTCKVAELGTSRTISNLTPGERLVFGLQALPLVYNGGGSNINLPNTNYFFTGSAQNNSDARGWADGQFHAKVLKLANNDYLVGFEDTWLGTGSTSDRDYNDLVFRFQGVSVTSPIPEPSSALLLLPGLAWMVAMLRRRRAAAASA